MPTRCALYARVSTSDQHCENQLTELRAFCAARGWTITREYVDHGVSGRPSNAPSSTRSWPMPAGAASTCSPAGGSTDSDATSGTWC